MSVKMSDYPERINISPVHRQKREDDFYLVDRAAFPGKGVEYIRADHALAMVAAEREACADTCAENTWRHDGTDEYSRGLDRGALNQACADAAAIRARTPDDAQATLDALLKAERVKALREAAEVVRGLAPTIEHDSTQDDRMHESILERAARHIERAVD